MNKFKLKMEISKREKIINEISTKYREKRKGLSRNKLAELSHEYQSDAELIDDEIGEMQTAYWRGKAYRNDIPLPDDNSCWKKSRITGQRHLTTKGVHEIKKLIREEASYIFAWGALITGLIAAGTGLISVCISFYKSTQ